MSNTPGIAPLYKEIKNFVRFSELLEEWINGWVDVEYIDDDAGDEWAYLTEDEVYAPHYLLEPSCNYYNGDYTFSVYAKAEDRKYIKLHSDKPQVYEANTVFDLENGVIVSGEGWMSEDLGDGVYRCAVTSSVLSSRPFHLAIMIVNDDLRAEYIGDKTKGLWLVGAQFEASDYSAADTEPETYTKSYGYPATSA